MRALILSLSFLGIIGLLCVKGCQHFSKGFNQTGEVARLNEHPPTSTAEYCQKKNELDKDIRHNLSYSCILVGIALVLLSLISAKAGKFVAAGFFIPGVILLVMGLT